MQIFDHELKLGSHVIHWYESGQGPAVILLHGGGGTGRAFVAQLSALGDRGYRVLAPDMPGFGQSDWFPQVSHIPDISPILFDWLHALSIDAWVIGGNSMGGRVAMSMASLDNVHSKGLIVLDSVGLDLADVPVTNPLTLPKDRYMQGLVYDANRYKARTPYRTLKDAQELNRGRTSFARYLQGDRIAPDPALDRSRLTMPALLIWGRTDQIVPLAYGQALEKELPMAELLVIDQCGHLPHIEEPDITNHAIVDFLERRVTF